MIATFRTSSANGSIVVSDDLLPFFLWLAKNRSDERAASLLTLIAAHDSADADEQANIRRTIAEILENAKVLP
jgi:hypothetical protein